MKRSARGGLAVAITTVLVSIVCLGAASLASNGVSLETFAATAKSAPPISQEINPDLCYRLSLLSDTQRNIYDKLLVGFQDHDGAIALPLSSATDVQEALDAVLDDHPELFWVEGDGAMHALLIGETHYVYSYTPDYTMSYTTAAELSANMEATADAFLATLDPNATDYEMALAIHDYVVSRTYYSLDAQNSQTIVGPLEDGCAVCAGYSSTFQYLMQRAGLFCAYVRGHTVEDGENVSHVWNMVRIAGEYSYVDCTYDDPLMLDSSGNILPDDGTVRSTAYFCVGDEFLFSTHTLETPALWPPCESIDAIN